MKVIQLMIQNLVANKCKDLYSCINVNDSNILFQECLDRVVKLHNCLDLEWLRHAPPDKVK